MTRAEYMDRLEALLQDVPFDERKEAMQYYNDYFDEAGEAKEEEVAAQLDSPEKVAAAIKADLYGNAGDAGEYRETGYTDTRFERKASPAEYSMNSNEKKAPWTNKWVKILLIAAILIVGFPVVMTVVGPIALVVLVVLLLMVFSGFLLLICGVITTVCIMFSGIILFIEGLRQIPTVTSLPLIGGGMLSFALGMAGTVLLVKLCMKLFPIMFRGLVNICRKPFHHDNNRKGCYNE